MNARQPSAVCTVWAAALLLGGCGNLTSGGFGDLEVLVASDSVAAAEPSPSASTLQLLTADVPGAGRQPANGGEPLDGTLTLRVQVFALARADAAIEVTDGIQEVVMPLSGGSPVVLARKSLPAGPYAVIRTVFLHVEAVVEGGLVVDGVAIRGPVQVDLGQGSRLVVDTPIALTIDESVPARIGVNLHTARWIRLLTQDRRVRAEDFQGEVRIGRQP
jgi:hypothetical protein